MNSDNTARLRSSETTVATFVRKLILKDLFTQKFDTFNRGAPVIHKFFVTGVKDFGVFSGSFRYMGTVKISPEQ